MTDAPAMPRALPAALPAAREAQSRAAMLAPCPTLSTDGRTDGLTEKDSPTAESSPTASRAGGLKESSRSADETHLPEHIVRGFVVDDATGCWVWQRSCSPDGYGWTSLNDKTHQAHRLVYRLLRGEPPEGTVLDHLCRVRHCVNPDHLEPVSPRENLERSALAPTGQERCLRCDSEFVQVRGQRRCPECLRRYEQGRRAAKARQERERRARLAAR